MKQNIKLILWRILAILAILPLFACDSGSEPPVVPRFEATACQHALSPDSTTKCGYLVVPEDRSVANGKTVKIYVGIFKDPSGGGVNEPLFYLTGGPGASTASAYGIFENTSLYIRKNFGDNRDVVVIDQRGTNLSEPDLYCSKELGPLRDQVYGMSYRDAANLRIQALGTCYSRLQSQGIDLSAYDSLENAADVNDLRKVLGYKKINLYGASYGTRLAMLTMKHYPETIRSVVIDSILPPEINPFEQETPGVLYSFRTFFDAAKAAYPNLETQFTAMMDALAANPVDATGHHYNSQGAALDAVAIKVTGVKMASYLVDKLKATPYDKGLPKKISDMYNTGDYTPVADAWVSSVDFFFPSGGPGSGAPSIGMYNSIFSAQDTYYTSPQRIEQLISQNVSNPSLASWLETHFIYAEPGILGTWPVKPLPFNESDPVVSDIPTLMLVGSLDNATPEIFSKPAAAFLSNSYYFTILAGHATGYLECVDQMINSFVKDPSVSPVNACPSQYEWL